MVVPPVFLMYPFVPQKTLQIMRKILKQKNIWKFFFFYIFLSSFLQKYMVRKKICKIIHLAPWGTAAGTYRRAPLR
jgi:hypothetical protein